MTLTDVRTVPALSAKLIVSLYDPALRPESETATVTLCAPPAFKVLPVGLMLSQPEPLAVEAVQETAGPQLVSVTVCVPGSPWPCVPVNESDPVLTCKHGGGGDTTTSDTATFTWLVPVLVVIVNVIVSL